MRKKKQMKKQDNNDSNNIDKMNSLNRMPAFAIPMPHPDFFGAYCFLAVKDWLD